jgi:hypothetical protein
MVHTLKIPTNQNPSEIHSGTSEALDPITWTLQIRIINAKICSQKRQSWSTPVKMKAYLLKVSAPAGIFYRVVGTVKGSFSEIKFPKADPNCF